jgi:hypothetical protein
MSTQVSEIKSCGEVCRCLKVALVEVGEKNVNLFADLLRPDGLDVQK